MADLQVKSGNLLPPRQGIEIYGVKFTILSDGKVCANGTPTQDYTLNISIPVNISGDYYFSGCPSGGSYSSYDVYIWDKTAAARPKMWDGTTASLSDFGDSANNQVKIVAGHETDFRIRVRQGYELRNVIFSPYLREPTSPPHYMPYSSTGWLHSLRKLTTATDTLASVPVDIYADGNNATVGISGNTVQNGTPSPDNPIMPQGTGERTGNLFDYSAITTGYRIQWTNGAPYADDTAIMSDYIPVTEGDYTLNISLTIIGYAADKSYIGVYRSEKTWEKLPSGLFSSFTILSNTNVKFVRLLTYGPYVPITNTLMLNLGSTALPYEPYGYKIPISSAGQTTPVYLGEVESTRRIKKLVLTGEENWEWVTNGTGSYARLTIGQINSVVQNAVISSHFTQAEIISSTTTVGVDVRNVSSQNAATINIRPDNADTQYIPTFTGWLAAQYANGTPVCVWYVLATEETAVVNEPLCKIGDYVDTVSGIIIPVTTGGDTISVDTTIQPSEVTATYTGWHNTSVKEKSENLFDKSSCTDGYEISAGGEIRPSEDWSVSDYIQVDIGTSYYGTNTGDSVILYDSQKNKTRGVGGLSTSGITVSANEVYMRISLEIANKNTAIVSTEGKDIPYEPYWK